MAKRDPSGVGLEWCAYKLRARVAELERERDEARKRLAVIEKELWETRLERDSARAERDYFYEKLPRQTEPAR